MFQASFLSLKDVILLGCSTGWTTAGTWAHGAFWTASTSESPSAAAACSLSQVLEPAGSIPPQYFLSPLAGRGILRRAPKRGRRLPLALEAALTALAAMHPDAAAKTT